MSAPATPKSEADALRALLTDCAEKLRLYYDRSAEYVGGVEHSALQRRIEAALTRPAQAESGEAREYWVRVPRWKMERAATCLENRGEDCGVARDLRDMLAAPSDAPVAGDAVPVAWGWHDGSAQFISADDKRRRTASGDTFAKSYTVPLYAAPPAAEQITAQGQDDARDAARYRWLRDRARGDGATPRRPQSFLLPHVEPVSDLMRGSVAQHLDAAIDAAMHTGAEPQERSET